MDTGRSSLGAVLPIAGRRVVPHAHTLTSGWVNEHLARGLGAAAGAVASAYAGSAAAATQAGFRVAAGGHGNGSSRSGVGQANFCAGLTGDDDTVTARVSSGVAGRGCSRAQVERASGACAFIASSTAREGFAASDTRWRRHDAGRS